MTSAMCLGFAGALVPAESMAVLSSRSQALPRQAYPSERPTALGTLLSVSSTVQ